MNLLLPKKKGTQIEDNSTKKQRKHKLYEARRVY
jgi:hypothetical protein